MRHSFFVSQAEVAALRALLEATQQRLQAAETISAPVRAEHGGLLQRAQAAEGLVNDYAAELVRFHNYAIGLRETAATVVRRLESGVKHRELCDYTIGCVRVDFDRLRGLLRQTNLSRQPGLQLRAQTAFAFARDAVIAEERRQAALAQQQLQVQLQVARQQSLDLQNRVHAAEAFTTQKEEQCLRLLELVNQLRACLPSETHAALVAPNASLSPLQPPQEGHTVSQNFVAQQPIPDFASLLLGSQVQAPGAGLPTLQPPTDQLAVETFQPDRLAQATQAQTVQQVPPTQQSRRATASETDTALNQLATVAGRNLRKRQNDQ